jgi:tetratricopeptide (TPR) repeat protein
LRRIEKSSPFIPSLSYLIALAALQSGDSAFAEKNADASIAKRERIADSLALKAVIETQKPRAGSLGDPAAAAEAYLRQAASIEPGNPAPLIELSTVLRHKGDHDGALELLRSARNRLNPVDSHAVAETTIRLLELQSLEDKNLPTNLEPDGGTPALFSAAYVSMRTGRFAEAASLLDIAKKRLSPDLFLYLVNDPALRRFKDQQEVAAFFD